MTMSGELSEIVSIWRLQVFAAVVEAGGMTEAARRYGLTQPAVSRIISDLEGEFGLVLFDRSLRPISLTLAGRDFLDRALHLLQEARQLRSSMRGERALRPTSLTVGVVDSFNSAFGAVLAHSIRDLAARISIWNGLSPILSDYLLQRKVDLVVSSDPMDGEDGLERYHVLTEPFILLFPRGFPIQGVVDLASISEKLPLLRHSARSHTGRFIDKHLRRTGLGVGRHQEFDSTEVMAAAVKLGHGWAISTPLCAQAARVANEVQIVPFPSPGFQRQINVICRAGETGTLAKKVASLSRAIVADGLLPLWEGDPHIARAMIVGRME